MRRRAYLAACGLAAVAGCSGASDSAAVEGGDTPTETASDTTKRDTATATTTSTTTETATETAADLAFGATTLKEVDRAAGTSAVAATTVRNDSPTPSGTVSLDLRFYDTEDSLVTTTTGYLETLPGETTWDASIPALSTDDSQLARVEVEGEFEKHGPLAQAPQDVSLDESALELGDDVRVTGQVTNNRPGTIDYLQATALYFADDATVLGSSYTNIQGVPAGETWSFETFWNGAHFHPATVRSHRVIVTDTPL